MRPFKISTTEKLRPVGFLLPGNLHREVVKKCIKKDVTLTRVIKDFLKKWVKK